MEEQRLFYKKLKEIKDYWVEDSIKTLKDEVDFVTPDCIEAYQLLKTRIDTDEYRKAYKKVINGLIKGVMHSLLVTFDGDDDLAAYYKIDIINADTKVSLKENIALHEEFYGYLLDAEDDEY